MLPTPLASQLGPIETLMKARTAFVMPLLFGGSSSTALAASGPAVSAPPTATAAAA